MPTTLTAPNTRPRLMTIQAAAREYGMPERTLRELVLAGVFPCIRFSQRRIWLERADVEAAIAAAKR
jgi:hypothetical protein